MLRAVRLYDQPLLQREKVYNIGRDHLLAAKLGGPEPLIAKQRPQALLRLGQIGTHPPGAGKQFLPGREMALTLPPAARAGPSLSRKGRGVNHAIIPSGFSTRRLKACIRRAPSAPSMARWSKLPVALITVAIWSESFTT